MGRVPCCEKEKVKRGQWTPEEDNKLSSYIAQHGTRNWRLIPKNAGLQRCGKSCRLRWTNYLRLISSTVNSLREEETIMKLHAVVGNRWSLIAAQLPGRTDNDVKNHWNTKLKKKLTGMGIDPVTHKSFSHLMAEIATTLGPPQVANLTEAALGCFKDEMLHLLTKKRIDPQLLPSSVPPFNNNTLMITSTTSTTNGTTSCDTTYSNPNINDHHHHLNVINGSIMVMGGQLDDQGAKSGEDHTHDHDHENDIIMKPCWELTRETMGHLNLYQQGDHEDIYTTMHEDGDHSDQGSIGIKKIGNGSNGVFSSDSVLWDLPTDELVNPMI